MSKQIKGNAASKAAPVQTVRSEVTALAKAIKATDTRMSTLLIQGTDLYITGDLNDKEKSALTSAIPKQRRADFNAIVNAPSNYREEAEYPKGFQARAKYLSKRADGYAPADARDIANNKKTKRQVDEANGKKDEGKKDEGKQSRTTQLPVADSQPSLAQLRDAMTAVEKEYGGAGVDDTIAAMKDQIAEFIKALANA